MAGAPMSLRRGCAVAVLLGLAGPAAAPAGALTGAQVIEQVQRRFAEHRTFSARFEKQFYWAAIDRKQTLRGRIFTSRPNRFRLETEGGDLVVADGQAIWVYDRRNQQAVVSPYAGAVRTPWEVLTDYQTRYVPQAAEEVRLNGRLCHLVSLGAVDAAEGEARLRLWVSVRDGRLAKVEQVEAGGDVTTYLLSDHRVDAPLDPALFRFEVPSGVQLIDRRGPQGGGG
jgi:chaperone LolA